MRRKNLYEVKAYYEQFFLLQQKKNLCYNEAPIKKVKEYISSPSYSIKCRYTYIFFYREKENQKLEKYTMIFLRI